jgi:hypothetical protein
MKSRVTGRFTQWWNFSIRPSNIIVTKHFSGSKRSRTVAQVNNEINLKSNSAKGLVSRKARQKLLTATHWLIASSKKIHTFSKKHQQSINNKLAFITLTIPPQNDDYVSNTKFKVMLNAFFTYHRKFSNLKNYVWKLEAHKDGRLHVHILIGKFIHYNTVRNSWNRILMKNGCLENHFEKFCNYNPNSTDIHGLHSIKDISAYISKYMCKEPNTLKDFRGRIWGCSVAISEALTLKDVVNDIDMQDLTQMLYESKVEQVAIEIINPKTLESHWFGQLYKLKLSYWGTIIKGTLYDLFNQQLQRIINYEHGKILTLNLI